MLGSTAVFMFTKTVFMTVVPGTVTLNQIFTVGFGMNGNMHTFSSAPILAGERNRHMLKVQSMQQNRSFHFKESEVMALSKLHQKCEEQLRLGLKNQ